MSTPEKSPSPPRKHPVTKATMDAPQEEFIADTANSAAPGDDESPRGKEEPEKPEPSRKSNT